MHPYVNTAITAARLAGNIINRYIDRLDTIEISEKQQNDFVSEVDREAERAIINCIHRAYPDHSILAEESGASGDEQSPTWIIDPLDGTRNYLHGFPHFGVSIAVKKDNRIEHGVIFDPIRQEIFSASRGYGAQLNNRRLRVSKNTQLEQALIGTGFPFREKHLFQDYLKTFSALFYNAGGIRRAGAAALDLAYVAAGRLDGFWEYNLRPWDIAAGILLVKEAGGLVIDTDGGEKYYETGNIVAGNPKICKAILQTIRNA